MIYIQGRSCFVHIPRTSGLSVCASIAAGCPAASVALVTAYSPWLPINRHSRAVGLQYVISDWSLIKKWTIVRHPFDIVSSTYRLIKHTAHHPTWNDPVAMACQERAKRHTFESFINEELGFLRVNGGYYRHWCMDGDANLGVVPFRYDEVDGRWGEIADLAGFSSLAPRIAANQSQGDSPQWTPALMNIIADWCKDDFDRFGWQA